MTRTFIKNADLCLANAPGKLKEYLEARGVDLNGADKASLAFWVTGEKLPDYGLEIGRQSEAALILPHKDEPKYFTAPIIIDCITGKTRKLSRRK